MRVMALIRCMLAAVLLLLPLIGGCAQRVAVEGNSDQLFAEARGALESEGFHTMGAHSSVLGAKGTSRKDGRLQFLYYADNIAPTVVEVRIEPSPHESTADAAVGSAVAAVATSPAEPQGAALVAAEGVASSGSDNAAQLRNARRASKSSVRPHSVAVSAWSSLTFAPDPWIADLAVVALRRAYLLSGNIR